MNLTELEQYLDAVIGDDEGYLHTAVGIGPFLDKNGKYRHKRWSQNHYRWPAQRRQVLADVLAAAEESDAYLCPYLMIGEKRGQGAATARRLVHADIDGGRLDPELVAGLGGFAVASGSPGNGHAYLRLSEPVPAHWHRELCRGLGAYLGAVDAKISDNDVLRPPGTVNRKAEAAGGQPAPVRWIVRPDGTTWDPHTLADKLGITLPENTPAQRDPAPPGAAEPVDLENLPAVKTALGVNSGDRSADTMRVVGACLDAGLSLPQTRWAVNSRRDLVDRLADRHDDDVATCYSKATQSRQSQITELARTPITLEQGRAAFRKWLGDDYDTDTLDAMLSTAAVEKFGDGSDPVWLLVVGGPGNAKTETVQACDGIGAIVTSSLSSEAALLSATPKRERSKAATGGLLRKLGDRGVLVVKDVTSILSMNRDLRARVLAALREVYDGRWYREVGTDGGLTIPWQGRIAVIGAVTTAWDTAHAVISSMGDRFVLVRLDSTTGRQRAGRKAIGNTGSEQTMRAELAAAVAGVLAGMNLNPITVTDQETDVLLAAADLVTLARTGVEYDYKGDVIDAHAPEMPTRFAKQLTQILRGAVAVGMPRDRALRLAIRCARDSMPPLRLAIIEDLAANPSSSTAEVRKRIDKPRNTVDRQLQALHILGVATVEEIEYGSDGKTKWFYSLAAGIDPAAIDHQTVPDLSVHTPIPSKREEDSPALGTDISGTSRADLAPRGDETTTEPLVDERFRCKYCDAMLAAHRSALGYCFKPSCIAAHTAEAGR